jgi:hypothetical protein
LVRTFEGDGNELGYLILIRKDRYRLLLLVENVLRGLEIRKVYSIILHSREM